jgi:hypothetical protein
MNANQREIISDMYKHYIECCMRSDVSGFTSDMCYFFENIRDTDKKLDELMKEIYEETPDK